MSCLPAHGGAGRQLPDLGTPQPSSLGGSPDDVRNQIGDEAVVQRVRHDYMPCLGRRIQAIAQAMREDRIDECINQLLILETSSHVAGADELSLRAAALRLAVAHRRPDVGVLFSELARAARLKMDGLSGDTSEE